MQRNKRLRKSGWRAKGKKTLIVFMFFFMILGIMIVNSEIKRKGFLENSNLIKLNIDSKSFDFLGKKYYIDFNILKENLSKIKNVL